MKAGDEAGISDPHVYLGSMGSPLSGFILQLMLIPWEVKQKGKQSEEKL